MKTKFALVVLFCLKLFYVPCDGQSLEAFQNQMAEIAEHHLQEKIHVHTDRELYAAGETIWYKIYATIGLENRLSALSHIGYVELVDPLGKIVERKTHGLFNGVALGEVELADTLTEGSYRLRSYTNWMRNDSADYFFEKILPIGNLRTDDVASTTRLVEEDGSQFYEILLQEKAGEPAPKARVQYHVMTNNEVVDKGRESLSPEGVVRIKVTDKNRGKPLVLQFEMENKSSVKKILRTDQFFNKNDLQYFPEGGAIVGDEMNRLAFKSVNPEGLGISADVTIFTSSRDTAARFQTNTLGMGSVPCYIAMGEQYTAEATFADGTTSSLPIQSADARAISLSVNAAQTGKLFAQANLSPSRIDNSDIYLSLQHLGTIYYMAKQKANQKNVLFSIPKENLPTGIMTLTLMNEQLIPLSERAVFNYNPKYILEGSVSLNQNNYQPRDQVVASLSVGGPQDSVRVAALSASVVNTAHFPTRAHPSINILTSLLLSSDLQGFVEQPSFYFDTETGYKAQEIDDLLLTQGWRRIQLHQLDTIANETPTFIPEKGLSIKGYTRKIGRKAPVPGATVQLISTHNFMDFIDTLSNEDGRFVFDELLFPDSIKFLLSAKDQKGKNNIDITTDPFIAPPANLSRHAPLVKNDINRVYHQPFEAAKAFYKELESKGLMENVLNIEAVTVTARKPKAAEHSSNLNGPGNADQVLSADDLSTCATLEMCLTGRLVGVYFQGGQPYNTRGNVPMQVVLDGMYMDGDALSMINPMDVQSVEVLRNANYTAIYGSHGGGGLLVITSKTGRDARESGFQPRGLLTVQPQGVAISKDFYKPVYQPDSSAQFQNDLRTTIHWEPSIVTDEKGDARFDFYTSDEPGIYRIIIEGVDLNGRLLHRIEEFEVK